MLLHISKYMYMYLLAFITVRIEVLQKILKLLFINLNLKPFPHILNTFSTRTTYFLLTKYIPSSGLIYALSNEVGGEGVIKLLLFLERIVNLGVGHASTLKPTVKHFRGPSQNSFPKFGGNSDTIHSEIVNINSYTESTS